MVMSMKMAVFWDDAPYSLVDTDQHFRAAYCLHHHGNLSDYMVQHPRRQPSSLLQKSNRSNDGSITKFTV
jgi:hypothetical protein